MHHHIFESVALVLFCYVVAVLLSCCFVASLLALAASVEGRYCYAGRMNEYRPPWCHKASAVVSSSFTLVGSSFPMRVECIWHKSVQMFVFLFVHMNIYTHIYICPYLDTLCICQSAMQLFCLTSGVESTSRSLH